MRFCGRGVEGRLPPCITGICVHLIFIFLLRIWLVQCLVFNREVPECFRYGIEFLINGSSSDVHQDVPLVVDTASLVDSGEIQDCHGIRFRQEDPLIWLDFWWESGCNRHDSRVWITPFFNSTSILVDMFYGCQTELGLTITPPLFFGSEAGWDGHFYALTNSDCPSAIDSTWVSATIDLMTSDQGIYRRNIRAVVPPSSSLSVADGSFAGENIPSGGHFHSTSSTTPSASGGPNYSAPSDRDVLSEVIHQHPLSHLNFVMGTGTSSVAPFIQLEICEGRYLDLFQNSIVLLEGEYDLGVDLGWRRFSEADEKILSVGECLAGACLTGGHLKHWHRMISETLTGSTHDTPSLNIGTKGVAQPIHYHPVDPVDTSDVVNWPTHAVSVLGQYVFPDSPSSSTLKEFFFFVSSVPPKGWKIASKFDRVFIKGSQNAAPTIVVAQSFSHSADIVIHHRDDSYYGGLGYDPGGQNAIADDHHGHSIAHYVTSDSIGQGDIDRVDLYVVKYDDYVGVVERGNAIVFDCDGVFWKDPAVCGSHGSCDPRTQTCECDHGYDNSTSCRLPNCYGRTSLTGACSSRGICAAPDTCICPTQTFGFDCEFFLCFGRDGLHPEISQACNYPAGVCVAQNQCRCNKGFGGVNCSTSLCNLHWSNSSNVCSGFGDCRNQKCYCSEGHTGENCEIPVCFGAKSPKICNNHGTCVHPDQCVCEGYAGANCEFPVCYGKSLDGVSEPCSSPNGRCQSPNDCLCATGWSGKECDLAICFGNQAEFSGICSSHGNCVAPNNCSCDMGWIGDRCSAVDRPQEPSFTGGQFAAGTVIPSLVASLLIVMFVLLLFLLVCHYRCPLVKHVSPEGKAIYFNEELLKEIDVKEKKIGSGVFGAVCQGTLMLRSNPLAIEVQALQLGVKIISNGQGLPDLEFRNEVETEASIAISAHQGHPNIVKTYGMYRNEKFEGYNIVMEYCEMGDAMKYLNKIKKEDRLTDAIRMKLILDAACGLEHLHRLRIVHRDFKPQNLLVCIDSQTGEPIGKICDFGFSRNWLDCNGSIRGTPGYMPPPPTPDELKDLFYYYKNHDVYSFGISCYVIWTLKEKFVRDYFDVVDPVRKERMIHSRELRPSLEGNDCNSMPFQLKDLMERCWFPDSAKRPAFSRIVAELREMMSLTPPEEFVVHSSEHSSQEQPFSDLEFADLAEVEVEKEEEVQGEEGFGEYDVVVEESGSSSVSEVEEQPSLWVGLERLGSGLKEKEPVANGDSDVFDEEEMAVRDEEGGISVPNDDDGSFLDLEGTHASAKIEIVNKVEVTSVEERDETSCPRDQEPKVFHLIMGDALEFQFVPPPTGDADEFVGLRIHNKTFQRTDLLGFRRHDLTSVAIGFVETNMWAIVECASDVETEEFLECLGGLWGA